MSVRYGAWHGGADPLQPPFDVRQAVDALGDDVLGGASPRAALQRLMRRGPTGQAGLDRLRQQARKRARDLRRRGQLDGTLRQVRELLDRAVAAERAALFPEPSDAARLAEAELDALPPDTARAVRALADHRWRSEPAARDYQRIQQLLRQEVLDAQFNGMKQAMAGAGPRDFEAIGRMLADLNTMLDADARGEHTQAQFDAFMSEHGQFFPEQPANLAELVDALARRSAAAQRVLNSLTPQQRGELSDLLDHAMGHAGLGEQMTRLQANLRAARPDLDWERAQQLGGQQPLGYAAATEALAELADLEELSAALGQEYPGASLADIDSEQLERALGRSAVDDLDALKRIESELRQQGYLTRAGAGLALSPKALRRLGATALRRVFSVLESRQRGGHDIRDAGSSGELTGASRAWEFGDEQPLDVVRTVRNGVLRSVATSGAGQRVTLLAEDFEVSETERRGSAAVALLVDMSYSMELRGSWGEAKTTALALHALVSTRFPQDAIQIIGFSDYARVMTPAALVNHDWSAVQGTNLQHALMLARRHLDAHRGAEPVIMVITDGEPTAHLLRDGQAAFHWPPTHATILATIAEVERCTRRGATINVFMLDDDPGLVDFMEEVARRNGGRVFSADTGRLGEYVVSDYLRRRQRRRVG